MCFHSKQSKAAQELENRFKAEFIHPETYNPAIYNGFSYPKTPIIANLEPNKIKLFDWGLMPSWANKDFDRKNTLNARIETIQEKPSFKNSVSKRCLVLLDGFYEWQWLDTLGKKKQKYQIGISNNEAFALAGLWNTWVDKQTGEIKDTYTILTTEAQGLMREIHNSKLRMPVILSQNIEQDWLLGKRDTFEEVEIFAQAI